MNDNDVRGLIQQVKDNSLTRKQFIRQMVGVGLSVPTAAQMLLTSGLAQAQTSSSYKPTKRGGGGPLKLLCHVICCSCDHNLFFLFHICRFFC